MSRVNLKLFRHKLAFKIFFLQKWAEPKRINFPETTYQESVHSQIFSCYNFYMKINQKLVIFVLFMFILLAIGIYLIIQINNKVSNNISLSTEPNQHCLREANSLVALQKQSAEAMIPNKQNIDMQQAIISLDKSIFNKKLNMCIAQVHILFNNIHNGTIVLNTEQIFATYDNASKDTILAQYSPSLNDKTNFISLFPSGKLKTSVTESDLTRFEQSIELN